MKFTTQTKSLLKAAALAAQATPVRSPLPVLSCLKLEASFGVITITGASIENRIEQRAKVDVETPGSICVDAGKFVGALTRSQSESVSVFIDKNSLVMEMGSMRCRLSTIASEEFVSFDKSGFNEVTVISSDVFLKAVSDLKWVPKPSDPRLFCQCLHLGKYDGRMAVMATNGHCGLVRFLSTPPPDQGYSIPHGLVALFQSIMKDDCGTASISSNGRSIRLMANDGMASGQLMEINYPDLKMVFEKIKIDTSASIDRSRFIEACENCAIFSDDQFNNVRLTFSSDQLLLSAGSKLDSATDAVSISGGPDVSIKIRISYLISALKAFDSDTIRMEIGPSSILIQDGKTIFVCCLITGGNG